MKKEPLFYDIFIKNAFINKENDLIIEAFLDILDYDETVLTIKSYNVLISTYEYFLQDTHLFKLLEVNF